MPNLSSSSQIERIPSVAINVGSENISKSEELHDAITKGNWVDAERMIMLNQQDSHQHSFKAKNMNGETALHLAVKNKEGFPFVTKLVEMMPAELLSQLDNSGKTALHVAAACGYLRSCSLLLRKNPQLLEVINYDSGSAIHTAASTMKRKTSGYLLSFAIKEKFQILLQDQIGSLLMINLIESRFHDLAKQLLEYNPQLALMGDDSCILVNLARDPLAFPSADEPTIGEKLAVYVSPAHIRQKRLNQQAVELVDFVSNILKNKLAGVDETNAQNRLAESFFFAIENGVEEIVSSILKYYPSMVQCKKSHKDGSSTTTFHAAVAYRREKIWTKLYSQIQGKDTSCLREFDGKRRTILHLVGYPAKGKLYDRHKTVLEMQRELHWFAEIRKILGPPEMIVEDNTNRTPLKVFRIEHKQMVKEEYKSMTEMATACSVVASLVATIAFAAAITVPGGNKQEGGLPYFSDNKAFLLFAIFDSLALFSSIASAVFFLSIFTATYDIFDFAYNLPNRLIFGLISLSISVVSIMIAFSCTLFLVFAEENKISLIPIILFAFGTISIFASIQIPPLFEMIKSTWIQPIREYLAGFKSVFESDHHLKPL